MKVKYFNLSDVFDIRPTVYRIFALDLLVFLTFSVFGHTSHCFGYFLLALFLFTALGVLRCELKASPMEQQLEEVLAEM